jgi:hypothetical protein
MKISHLVSILSINRNGKGQQPQNPTSFVNSYTSENAKRIFDLLRVNVFPFAIEFIDRKEGIGRFEDEIFGLLQVNTILCLLSDRIEEPSMTIYYPFSDSLGGGETHWKYYLTIPYYPTLTDCPIGGFLGDLSPYQNPNNPSIRSIILDLVILASVITSKQVESPTKKDSLFRTQKIGLFGNGDMLRLHNNKGDIMQTLSAEVHRVMSNFMNLLPLHVNTPGGGGGGGGGFESAVFQLLFPSIIPYNYSTYDNSNLLNDYTKEKISGIFIRNDENHEEGEEDGGDLNTVNSSQFKLNIMKMSMECRQFYQQVLDLDQSKVDINRIYSQNKYRIDRLDESLIKSLQPLSSKEPKVDRLYVTHTDKRENEEIIAYFLRDEEEREGPHKNQYQ